jgi:hypothetical protein
MDLLATTRTWKLSDIKVLHLEPTTVCNAACPQCNRTIGAPFYREDQDRHELTLGQIRSNFSDDFIRGLDKMFMCGNFGEPAAAQECLEIFEYFRKINPDITLGMNTNGSLRTTHWWKRLAKIFSNSSDYVVWSIDGLADTNHVYRVNTHWPKIMENARAFIQAGGSAHWDMLIYAHNQHQVDLVRDLARDMGFTWFRAKVSKRFDIAPVKFLNPPVGWQKPNVVKATKIDCHALTEKSIYMAANGKVLPCCWFGAEVFNLDDHALELVDSAEKLSASWQTIPHRICSNTCGTDEQGTSFSKQWQQEVQLR